MILHFYQASAQYYVNNLPLTSSLSCIHVLYISLALHLTYLIITLGFLALLCLGVDSQDSYQSQLPDNVKSTPPEQWPLYSITGQSNLSKHFLSVV